MALLADAQLPALQNPQPQPLGVAADQIAAASNNMALAQQRIQQTRDTAAINAAIQQAGGDPDAAADLLDKSGSGTAAMALRTNTDARRKALGEQIDAGLKRQTATFGIVSQLANTLGPDSTPQAIAATKQAMLGAAGQNAKPLLDTLFPDNTTPDQLPSVVSKLNALSDSHAEHVQAIRDGIEAFDNGKDAEGVARVLAGTPAPQRQSILPTIVARLGPQRAALALAPFQSLDLTQATPQAIFQAGGVQGKTVTVGADQTLLQEAPPGSPAGTAPTVLYQGQGKGEQKDYMVNGVPTVGIFDPAKRTVTDLKGNDITALARPVPPASTIINPQEASNVKESVQGMADGTIPPILPSRASKDYIALMAEAHRQGVNLATLNEDWQATQKYLATLNGAQQTRLRQAINFTSDSLPLVRGLVNQWDSAGLPVLSAANLDLAASGAKGQAAQSLAVRLKGQLADLTSELGTVYKGGNSSTDESLKLAAQNLQGQWGRQAALDALDQIDKNITIRKNSIRNAGVAGIDTNPYAQGQQTQPSPPPVTPPAQVTKTFYGQSGKAFTATGPANGPFTSASGGVYDATGKRIK